MTGEVSITYNYDHSNGYQVYLSWKDSEGDREGLWTRSKESWQAARKEAIEKFKLIPPSESLVID